MSGTVEQSSRFGTENNRQQILILDADMGAALSVARSLHRVGYRISLASASDRRPLSAFSRSAGEWMRYPDPLQDSGAFINWLVGISNERDYVAIVPVTERSMVPISSARDRFRHPRLAVPPVSALETALDKSATLKLAEAHGVSTPRSLTISSLDELSTAEAEGLLPAFPMVIKPSRSVATAGTGLSKAEVCYASHQQTLLREMRRLLSHGPVILQERFEGDGVGVEVLADRGELRFAFQHRRLHEVPLTGGGSSLRVSETPDPVLLEASRRLLAALAWHGVAMVEFKQSPDRRAYRLMEINGRFWGSLPLAEVAGVNFPAALMELLLEGEVGGQPSYRSGIYCRNLPRDLMWLEAVLRSRSNELTAVPARRTALRDTLLMLSPRHYFDTQRLSDPVPGLIEIGRLTQIYARRLTGLMRERHFIQGQERAWQRGDIDSIMTRSEKVLFLCYGNINRSAVAEWLARSAAGTTRWHWISAGFHEEGGRPADAQMRAVATSKGLNGLDSHRSVVADRALLMSSDIIFVMERTHYETVRQLAPERLRVTFLLGAGVADGGYAAEIADPYGHDMEAYERAFSHIRAGIKRLLAMQRETLPASASGTPPLGSPTD